MDFVLDVPRWFDEELVIGILGENMEGVMERVWNRRALRLTLMKIL